jgi:hypothetical protein
MTQYRWKQRMRTTRQTPGTQAARPTAQKLRIVDRHGDAAVAIVDGEIDGSASVDYLLLLKIDGSWRCVGKVHSRQKSTPDSQSSDSFKQAVAELVAHKQLSDTGWHASQFLQTQHARGTVFNLDEGALVSASSAEWAERYVERKAERVTMHPIGYRIDGSHGAQDVGYVRWTIEWSDGSRWTDFALIVWQDDHWKMVNLAFVASE